MWKLFARRAPRDGASLFEAGERPPPLDQPWLAALMVCLCRQRGRQAWLVEIHAQRLQTTETDEGPVPGIAGWRYSFHGSGLLLSGPDNEQLDVDFHGDSGATIDPYFFAHRVLALAPRPSPEATLVSWLPTDELIVEAIEELRRAGLVEHPSSKHVFRLRSDWEASYSRLATLDVPVPFGIGLGAHRDWLLSLLHHPDRTFRAVEAAAQLLPPVDAAAAMIRLLDGPIGTVSGRAIEQLRRLPGDASPAVRRFLSRADPQRDHPFSATMACTYLLERGVARDEALRVLFSFAEVRMVAGYGGNPMIDALATLALEHAPERAIGLVRRALRDAPIAIEEMGRLLAAIDQRWCHRELASAAVDPALTASERRRVVRALASSSSEVARRRALELAPPPPVHDASVLGYTFDEVDFNTWGNDPLELDSVRALADKLRACLNDDFGADR